MSSQPVVCFIAAKVGWERKLCVQLLSRDLTAQKHSHFLNYRKSDLGSRTRATFSEHKTEAIHRHSQCKKKPIQPSRLRCCPCSPELLRLISKIYFKNSKKKKKTTSSNSVVEKQATQLKIGQEIWINIFPGKHSAGQQTCETMLNIINYQGTADESHNSMFPHNCHDGYSQKDEKYQVLVTMWGKAQPCTLLVRM